MSANNAFTRQCQKFADIYLCDVGIQNKCLPVLYTVQRKAATRGLDKGPSGALFSFSVKKTLVVGLAGIPARPTTKVFY